MSSLPPAVGQPHRANKDSLDHNQENECLIAPISDVLLLTECNKQQTLTIHSMDETPREPRKPLAVVPRSYQLEMFEASQRQNIIVAVYITPPPKMTTRIKADNVKF